MSIIKMTMAEYQAHPAVSRSYLVDILKSPAHAQAAKANRGAPTKAMIIGSATHTVILEPWEFDKEFCIADIDGRTREGRNLLADLKARGISPVTTEQMEMIKAMDLSVRNHKSAFRLLQTGYAEESIFWIDKETGIQCKARTDFRRDDGIIPDLKTCLDASPEAFQRTLLDRNYHVQAAMYLDGLNENNIVAEVFVFIAVEKEPPFAVGVYVLDNDFVEIGRQQYKKALQILAQCIKDKKYPAYSEDIVELKPPMWALTKEI